MSDPLDVLASGCILGAYEAAEPPEWVREELSGGLAGVVLFARNVREPGLAEQAVAALRAEQPDALVAIDEEGGDVTRLEVRQGSSYPAPLALGAIDDVETTRAVGRALAADLAAVGIDVELAPSADVNVDPLNPVIGTRSFGADPHLVARHAAAFVEGVQSCGVAACAKHFPGHGDTRTDSHHSLPVVDVDAATLAARELVPFRAAIAAGVRIVMTGHVVVPALDDQPATTSRRMLTELLRDELGFDGLVVSDALEMQAIAASQGIEGGAVAALRAGVDLLCLGARVDHDLIRRVRTAIVEAVRAGELAEERLADAAARVRDLQRWTAPVVRPQDADVGLRAARRALRVQGDARLGGPALVLELETEAGMAAGPAEHGLGAILSAQAPGITRRVAQPSDVPTADDLNGRRPVIVVRDLARHPEQRAYVDRWLALAPDSIVVEVGVPGAAGDLPALIETLGAGRASLVAAADVLLGRG